MVNTRQHDLSIGGKGFMLARASRGGRSWHRRPVPDVPGSSSPGEARFGNLPPEIRFTETFDDFSGGDGWAYRSQAPANAVHWSENFDLRFPGQAVHCQAVLFATLQDPFDGGPVGGVQWLQDVPLANPTPETGFGGIIAYGRRENIVGDTDSHILYPKSNLFPAALDATYLNTTTRDGKEGPPAVFGSYVYIGGSSGNYFRGNLDGGALGAVGSVNAHGFVNAGNRLWAAVGPFRRQAALRSLAPPTSGSFGLVDTDWSASIVLGNGRGPIQDLVSLDDQVFAGLPDGIYAGDQTGTFVNVTGEVGQNANLDNFRDLAVHEGEVVGQHVSGIYAYNPRTTSAARVRSVGPVQRSSRSPVRGYPTALTSHGGWLYAGQWTGSQSYLRAGREVGPGDWRWYTLQRMRAPGKINRLHVDGVTYGSGVPAKSVPNRFWVAMAASFNDMSTGAVNPDSSPLCFWPVPPQDGNPLAGGPAFSANYVGSARLDLPAIDRNAPGVDKVWESVEVWADAVLSGLRYADVYVTPDRGTRVLAGKVNTSPVTTLVLGSLNGSFVTARTLEVSLESFTDAAGTSPVYRAVVVRGRLRPRTVEVIDAVLRASDGMTDRYGTPMRPAAVVVDDLREMADPLRLGNRPHQLVDLAGATSWVTVRMPEESEVWQQGQEEPEVALNVQMAVMTFSV